MGTSILDAKEINLARVGPRELKDPRSRAYAIQTLYALKRYAESLRCDEARVAKELAEIERYRHWEVLGYASKEAMLDAELSDLGRANTEKAQQAAEQAIKDDGDRPLPRRGEVGRGRDRSYNVRPNPNFGNAKSYLARRLKRDHPDIFEQLKAGAYRSVRAAAKDAGLVREKTALEQLTHWWAKATPDDRSAFLRTIAQGEVA